MRCAVYGCNSDNQAKQFTKDIMFFRFPTDKKITRIWKNACKRTDDLKVNNARI